MQNFNNINAYWQQDLRQEALVSLSTKQIIESSKVISSAECSDGVLVDKSTIEDLMSNGSDMVVVPVYARRDDSYFIPFVLSITLTEDGKFIPSSINPLPIMQQAVLEPSDLCPISLGAADAFDNYLLTQTPSWIDDQYLLTWAEQLKYAQSLLHTVTDGIWLENLHKLSYYLQDSALILPVSSMMQPAHMDIKLLQEANKIELIEAERNSGKNSYIRSIILDAWINAAVKRIKPPRYIWYKNDNKNKYSYTTIFDLITDNLSKFEQLYLPEETEEAHKLLVMIFNAYIKGKQLAKNWHELSEKIDNKYADKGGIQARILQLQSHLKDAHARNRHMQVLYSIWLRQCELLSSWNKFFDCIPSFRRNRLDRLYKFFRQNFPNEDVSGLSELELQELMSDKIRRSANSERFIADSLHQTENDLRQEQLAREKSLEWSIAQNTSVEALSEMLLILDKQIWPKLLLAARNYWCLEFAANTDSAEYISAKPDCADTVIFEHAEYVSPMIGAELLAISKKAIIMGSAKVLTTPRFPVQVDYNLANICKLVTCDEEFEDLQFSGISASVGNLWDLALQNREVNKIFPSQRTTKLNYEFIDISSVSETYLGSRINRAEAEAILSWLENNAELVPELSVYTTFAGQRKYISDLLLAKNFYNIKVQIISVPCFEKSSLSIFSPVYTVHDAPPYSFDSGLEIINNLIDNTLKKVIVFGDCRIFNPDLHSASGKFAQLIFNKKEQGVLSV